MDLPANTVWGRSPGQEGGRSRSNSGSKYDFPLRRRPRSALRRLSHDQENWEGVEEWSTGQDTETTKKGEGTEELFLTVVAQWAHRQFPWNVWTNDYKCE